MQNANALSGIAIAASIMAASVVAQPVSNAANSFALFDRTVFPRGSFSAEQQSATPLVGGAASRPCEAAGTLLNVPYSADYAFYRKGG